MDVKIGWCVCLFTFSSECICVHFDHKDNLDLSGFNVS